MQTLIDLTREKKIKWEIHEISKYPGLEPDALVEKPAFTQYKNRNLLFYEERLPPFKPGGETMLRMQIVSADGQIVDDFPNTPGMDELYAVVKVYTRSEVAQQLDKVVEALALATKRRQVEWQEEKAEIFGLDSEALTSPVYTTEFKGKKFALFYEHVAGSGIKHVETRAALWILTPDNIKLRDCHDVLGVDILFRMVNIKQPDFKALDKVIDGLVSATIKDVVSKIKPI